jgi:hypothetical protein
VESYLRPQAPGNVGYVLREIETQSSGVVAAGVGDGDGRGEFTCCCGCMCM